MPETDPLAGQIVSHYRVIQKLGGGGMGIVYKAEDVNLHRFVALKFLPDVVTSDSQALNRFRREAQSASALNHPNICTIYEIGEQHERPYIAMEFLEGQTLNDLIEHRALSPDQVTDFGTQVADALEAAHAAGIIHRDIKPSNLFVTKRGVVKVLDFGLAKIVPDGPNSAVLQMTTVTDALLTNPGSAMGTIAYMSPEQARGQDLDYRTDLFSFGAVLYEMATAHRAFSGNTVALVHDAILNRDPAPATRWKPDVSPRLLEIIAKALEKDRELRYRSAAEIRTDLQRLKRDALSGSGAISSANSATALSPATTSVAANNNWIAIAALLGLVLLAAGLYAYRRGAGGTKELQATAGLTAIPFTSFKGEEVMPAFSPDGSQIVFAWDEGKNILDKFDLYVKVVGSESISRLTSKPSIWLVPAWSPDARTIAFARKSSGDDSGIFEVSAVGGPERKLAPATFTYTLPMSLSWSSDGNSLTYADGDGVIHLLDHQSAEVSTVAKPPQCDQAWAPVFSPVEPRIAFLCERNNVFLVFVVHPDGTGARQITTQDAGPQTIAWSSDGKRILLTNISTNQLMEVDIDDSRQTSILNFTQDAYGPAVALHADRLAYARSFENVDIWGTSLDPKNPQPHRLLVSSTRMQRAPDISPDGKRIAFESDRAGGGIQEIWVSNIDGSNPVQLSHFNHVLTGSPRWSPSGHLIAFDSRAGGQASVYLVDPDGGIPKRLATSIDGLTIPTWSRDGKSLYVCFTDMNRGEIYKVPVEGGSPSLVVKADRFIGNARESRDGKWLYFGKGAIATELRVVSVNGGQDHAVQGMPMLSDSVAWALADTGIYFIDLKAQPNAICFYDFATRHIRQIVALDKPTETWGGLALSPDEKWLAYSQADETLSDIMLVNNFH